MAGEAEGAFALLDGRHARTGQVAATLRLGHRHADERVAAGATLASSIEDLAREHLYPMPIYIGTKRHTFSTPQAIEETYRDIRKGLVAAGVEKLTTRVTAIEVPRRGRFRVWVDWHAHRKGEGPTCVALSVEYMRATLNGLRTEMSDVKYCDSLDVALASAHG